MFNAVFAMQTLELGGTLLRTSDSKLWALSDGKKLVCTTKPGDVYFGIPADVVLDTFFLDAKSSLWVKHGSTLSDLSVLTGDTLRHIGAAFSQEGTCSFVPSTSSSAVSMYYYKGTGELSSAYVSSAGTIVKSKLGTAAKPAGEMYN